MLVTNIHKSPITRAKLKKKVRNSDSVTDMAVKAVQSLNASTIINKVKSRRSIHVGNETHRRDAKE